MTAPRDGLTRRQFVTRTAALGAALALPASGSLWAADAAVAADPRLRSLDKAVRGPVLTPAPPKYANARLVFDSLYDGVHPLAVVQPLDATTSARSCKWARKTGVHIVAQLGRPQLRRLLDDRPASSSTSRTSPRVRVVGDAGGRRPGGAAREHLQRRSARTASRSRPGRARASASAGTRSAAASGSPHAPGGSPPTTSSPSQIVTADGKVPRRRRDPPQRPLLGLPRRRRRQLRDRHAAHIPHASGDAGRRTSSRPGRGRRSSRCSRASSPGRRRTRRARRALPARRRAGRADGAGLRPVPRQRDEPEGRARDARAAGDEARHRHRVVARPRAPLGRLPRPHAPVVLGARASGVRGRLRLHRDSPFAGAAGRVPPRRSRRAARHRARC